MRLLTFARFFPKPDENAAFWSMLRVRALQHAGCTVRVIAPIPYVPRFVASLTASAKPYTHCPPRYVWADVTAHYLRGPFHAKGPLQRLWRSCPASLNRVAWSAVWRDVEAIVDEFQPEALYGIGGWICGEPLRRLSERRGLPYIISEHDLDEISECESNPRRRAFYGRVYARASRVITLSERMGCEIHRVIGPVPTISLPNGSPQPPAHVLEQPKPHRRTGVVLFSAGWFYPRKAAPLLVTAFARVLQQHPSAELRIAGAGPEWERTRDTIRRLGIERSVSLLGPLTRDDLFRQMRDADLFVSAGYAEPLGNVFLEAMCVGTPVIASDDGGIAEVITDGVHGRLFAARSEDSLTHAMNDMLSNPDRLQTMGEAGLELTAKWTWHDWGARARDVVVQAVATQRRG